MSEAVPPTAAAPQRKGLSAGQILQIMGLSGMALIVAATAYLAWAQREAIGTASQRTLRDTAFFLADHGGRLFEVATIALGATAASIEDRSWDDIDRADDLQRQMKIIAAALPQVEDIWLNDATGRLRLTSFAYPTPVSNVSEREVFQQVRKGAKGMVVGDRIVGAITSRPTFLLAQRLSGPGGSFRGMVSVTADLSYFSDYWSKLKLPEGTVVSLIRGANSEVLAQYPAPAAGKLSPPAIWQRFHIDRLGLGAIAADSETGAVHRIADLPLYIAIQAPADAIITAWRGWLALVLPFAGVAFAGLAALTLAGFFQARREAENRRELEEAQTSLIAANAGLETTVAERTAELTETNEEIQRFAYIVSHDLRAPLVNIMGFTSELERLRSELPGLLAQGSAAEGEAGAPPASHEEVIEDFDEALGFIKSSIAKMDRLINAILALSRQGGRQFHFEQIDMNALIRSITDAMAHQMQEAETELVINDLPSLESDRLAIEQIFSNLIDNGLKYLRNDVPGRIEIKARPSGSYVVYEVRDNGRGISPDDHKRIFELFRRSGVQDRQGEGIGLAHVKALVRRLGGIITVESTLGEGTAFRVSLPLRQRSR